MPPVRFNFKAKVWLYQGPAAWHFVTLPKRLSAGLKKNLGFLKLGRGEATVNELAKPFAMSLPAVSKHLKVLQMAGLISRGKDA